MQSLFSILQLIGVFIVILLIVCFYLLPTIIGRNKKNIAGIALLNVFLGWTFFGWLGALIWAVCSPDEIIAKPQSKIQMWNYTCNKCGYRRSFDQRLKLYKCPQCGEEEIIH
jgi:predicted RNA-binding Zn-ribbon protein involved in translation (DUF1610 family)